MYKPLLITWLAMAVILSPVNAQAPALSTDGQTSIADELMILGTSTHQKTITPPKIHQNPNSALSLTMPLAGPSIHTNYTGSADAFYWQDINNQQYYIYGVENGRFIYQPNDTWFVYGLFGPIEAIKYDWNIKYPIWGNRHNGIDFAVASGTPVLSASGGEVVFIGISAGNTVIVQTDNFQITYGHLQSISVQVGEWVTQKDILGYSGSSDTPNPHLHFQIDEYRVDLQGITKRWAINPAKYLLPELGNAIIPNIPSNRYSDEDEPLLWKNLADDFRW